MTGAWQATVYGVAESQTQLSESLSSLLDSLLKSRDITLLTKVRIVKAMVFPVVMYGGESRTVKKAECQRFDAFELWCWRRLLSFVLSIVYSKIIATFASTIIKIERYGTETYYKSD